MSNLIEQLRKARTAAEVAALIPQMQQARIECQRRLDALEDSREDAVLKGGAEVRALKERVRDEQEQLSDWDAAMRAADRRHKEFEQAEIAAELDASAKRAAVDMRKSAKLREKFVDLIMQAAAVRDEDATLRSRIQQVAVALGKAGKQALKPVDSLQATFQASNVAYQHPITRPDFINPLKETAHFELLRKKLEAKARAA